MKNTELKKGKRSKNPNGRPPKHATAESIEMVGQMYFTTCNEHYKMPTKAGLCLALGISRDTYSEYRKKFTDTINNLDLYMEDMWAGRLSGTSATGAIFYLKNAFHSEYKDRTETDITSNGEQIVVYIPKRES